MTNINDSGSVPQTIDSNGNITPKPYGVSRWASPRVYECTHEECEKPAVVLAHGNTQAHNCCAQHGKEWGLE